MAVQQLFHVRAEGKPCLSDIRPSTRSASVFLWDISDFPGCSRNCPLASRKQSQAAERLPNRMLTGLYEVVQYTLSLATESNGHATFVVGEADQNVGAHSLMGRKWRSSSGHSTTSV
jgi:hypothetical protein